MGGGGVFRGGGGGGGFSVVQRSNASAGRWARGCGGEVDCAEKVGCELVVACRDAAIIFQPAEHALDRVAVAVEHLAEAAFPAPGSLGRNVRDATLAFDLLADSVGVIGPIGHDQG